MAAEMSIDLIHQQKAKITDQMKKSFEKPDSFIDGFMVNETRYYAQLNNNMNKNDAFVKKANSSTCKYPIHTISSQLKDAHQN